MLEVVHIVDRIDDGQRIMLRPVLPERHKEGTWRMQMGQKRIPSKTISKRDVKLRIFLGEKLYFSQ